MKKRVITPTILQMEATECGAVALAIILAYYGKYVPLEDMRVLCDVSRDGSNAASILQAARRLGLKANGYKVEIDKLASLTFPMIIYWQLNHFVVLEAIEKNHAYINDPASGRRKVDWDEFDVSYTGIVLLCSPEPSFQPGGKPSSVWETLHALVRHSRFAMLYIGLASFMLSFPAILTSGFSKIFIDDILIRGQIRWMPTLIIAMVLTAILQTTLMFLQRHHLLRLQLKFVSSTTITLLWKIFHLPMRFFQQRFAGDIADRVNANTRLSALLSNEVAASMVGLITLILYFIFLLCLDWGIALLELIASVGNVMLFYSVSEKMANLSRLTLQEHGKLMGIAMNNVQLIEMIKANGMEQKMFERFSGQHARFIGYQQKLSSYSQILSTLSPTINQLMYVVILALGGVHIIQGKLTVGSFIAIQSVLFFINQPLMTLLNFANNLQNIRGDLMRLNDVMNHEIDARHLIHSEPRPIKQSIGISIEQLSFGYSPSQPALIENIHLMANPGDFIALIGTSGSGKSSIAKLICGLFQPWSGKIKLDNFPLEHISPMALSKNISLVDQDIYLFSGTVRDNLTLWHEQNADAVLIAALQDACIWDEIAERGGLDATIEEGGNNWSGGQRQRIEIARALVGHTPLLILDEATSALDLILEKKIIANIRQRNCTVLAIAHRLSAIQEANQIYVLDQGKIIEHGIHAELIQQPNSVYSRLFQLEQNQI